MPVVNRPSAVHPVPSSRLNLSRSEAAERSASIRLSQHHVSLDLRTAAEQPELGFVTRSIITFTAEPGSTSHLDFVGRSVQRVQLNGRDIPVEYDGARIQLPALEAENQVTVTGIADYSRTGEGLHRFVDPADQKVYLYTQYEPADARRVFPTFEQPDLKAEYHCDVIAPAHWVVASNGAEQQRVPLSSAEGLDHWSFAPTQRISSYLTCVIAGEYARYDSSWSSEEHDIALAAYCRSSVAGHFDAEAVFALTRAGLDFFHRVFDYPYPFGKYDQAFVPEYNLGAMENPGLVTFTDAYVFTSRATDIQYQQRANTLMHEMAHMWFGDLVTMRWWDDLWLKESFADYMGTLAVAEATPWGTGSWVSFANRRKAWAYTQDQLPSTHPIVADIVDLEAAKQNFDGITYAKGASVLKQLVAFVGPEVFFAAARQYFRKHAFGNTSLGDFLAELSIASGQDMSLWARQWLQTSGLPTLSVKVEESNGVLERVRIHRTGTDPVTGESLTQPHALRLGVYTVDAEGALQCSASLPVRVEAEWTEVPELLGTAQPALLLPNDEDLSYAKIRFDEHSLATVLQSLDRLVDPLARTLCWSALWNMTRDAVLPATAYLQAVYRFGPSEANDGVLATLLDQAVFTLGHFMPVKDRAAALTMMLDAALYQLAEAPISSDRQLVWARHLASVARAVAAHGAAPDASRATGALRALLAGQGATGLVADSDLRWQLLHALAALGEADQVDLEQAREADGSSVAVVGLHRALAARPTAEAKAEAWRVSVELDELSNELLSAVIAGFASGPGTLRTGYQEAYFEALSGLWASRSIEIAGRLVRGLFPMQDALAGLAIEDHPLVQRTARWLEENPESPAALRRILIEEADQLRRALRAQQG
ncbi:aminopeptidase N [Psychromicrobium xiongbiense]|uniref:aminopeptidase N n=1 Tax=Psychromicrobium xiongbiense TaxID=3051184 RepID=UPI0025563009|nr:aminopeptidase N [Psychromicrobium sp. YIM S02556]